MDSSLVDPNKMLLRSVKYGLTQLAIDSINAGTNINTLDEIGDTVLMSAVYLELTNIVSLLINL